MTPGSPYLRGGILPSWAKLALVVRDEKVLTPEEARGLREGDHVYLLAPQEKAPSLDRFFANLPPPSSPDPELLGDFFVGGDTTLGALAEIYGIAVEPSQQAMTMAELFEQAARPCAACRRHHPARRRRAGGAPGEGRPRAHHRPATGRRGAEAVV